MVVRPLTALKNAFFTKNIVVRIFYSILFEFLVQVHLHIDMVLVLTHLPGCLKPLLEVRLDRTPSIIKLEGDF